MPSSIREGGVLGGIDCLAPSEKVVFWVVKMTLLHQRRWYRLPSSIREGGVLGGRDDLAPTEKVVYMT